MPELIFVFGTSAATGLFALGIWRFATQARPSPLVAVIVGVGVSLVMLLALTYVFYAVPIARMGRDLGVNLILPLLTYFIILIYARIRRQVDLTGLFIVGFLGLLCLVYSGFWTGLMVACSFGDCL